MGESRESFFRPGSHRSVVVGARDDRITSNAGVVLLRELDHRLGIGEAIAAAMHDPRRWELIRYELVELLRERTYAMAMGEATAWTFWPTIPRSGRRCGTARARGSFRSAWR
jgi:hypothetical protein